MATTQKSEVCPVGHDALAGDLAGHLRTDNRMTWCDLQLGPSHSARPDVYTLDKSFVRPNPTTYEVKISVSDFRSDVTSGKWQRYYEFSGAIYFAVPAGLISKADVPRGAGLIVRGPVGWRVALKATRQVVTIPGEVWLKLLIDGVEREGPRYRAKSWDAYACGFAKKFGREAAEYVYDAARCHDKIEQAEYSAKSIKECANVEADGIRKRAFEDAPYEWTRLLEALDLPVTAQVWQVKRAITQFENKPSGVAVQVAADLRRAAARLETV